MPVISAMHDPRSAPAHIHTLLVMILLTSVAARSCPHTTRRRNHAQHPAQAFTLHYQHSTIVLAIKPSLQAPAT